MKALTTSKYLMPVYTDGVNENYPFPRVYQNTKISYYLHLTLNNIF